MELPRHAGRYRESAVLQHAGGWGCRGHPRTPVCTPAPTPPCTHCAPPVESCSAAGLAWADGGKPHGPRHGPPRPLAAPPGPAPAFVGSTSARRFTVVVLSVLSRFWLSLGAAKGPAWCLRTHPRRHARHAPLEFAATKNTVFLSIMPSEGVALRCMRCRALHVQGRPGRLATCCLACNTVGNGQKPSQKMMEGWSWSIRAIPDLSAAGAVSRSVTSR